MNAEVRMQNAELGANAEWRVHSAERRSGNHSFRRIHSTFCILHSAFIFAFCVLGFAFPAYATPSQEDVFKSIQSTETGTSIDGRKLVAVLAAGAGVVIIVLLINNRQQEKELPRTLNHSGKLVRELMKTAGLKNAQIRQLKSLSDELADQNQSVENLVTLLLCPSLIKKARERGIKAKR